MVTTRVLVCVSDSPASIMSNYAILQETWVEVITIAHDTETKAIINVVQFQTKECNFFFYIVLGELILHHADMLSHT